MELKPLDPDVILGMLADCKDIITPLAAERERFYQDQACPRCSGTSMTKSADAHTIFRGTDPLPRYQLTCQNCDCLFDPHSGLILRLGNIGKAFVPSVPILKGPED